MKRTELLSASNPRLSLLVLLAGLAASPLAWADTQIWNGPSPALNNWSTGSDWTNATAGTAGTVPGATDDVKFFNPGAATTASNINNVVDLGFAGTIGSLQFGQTNGFHTTLIAPGQTLTVNGGLSVFTTTDPGSAVTVSATITGPGATLYLNNTSSNLVVNQGQGTGGSPRAILDLSGLDTVLGNLNRIGIGTTTLPNPSGSNQRDTGTLYLGKTNVLTLNYTDTLANYLTAGKNNALEMSRNPGNSSSYNYLYLGVSNAFFIDSLGIGRDKSTSGRYSGIMMFNPTVIASSPVAYFRGVGGNSSPVTWWGVGDMNSSSSSSQTASGTNDFSGGYLDALVNTMSLGRDGSPSSTASGANIGALTFTAGRLEVSTLFLGNQSLGPSTSSTFNEGFLTLNGANATLLVDNVLTLGNTVQNSTAAQGSFGVLNVTNGAVYANSITLGANTASAKNAINLSGATLIVTNALATSAKPLTNFFVSNATLGVKVTADGALKVAVGNLVTAGTTNFIQFDPTPAIFASYPQQFPLIKYSTWTGGNNFGLASVPAWAPGATLVNNNANNSLDLVLPYDPRPVITNLASQPVSVPANPSPGDNVTLSIGVSPESAAPLAYQWYLNSAPLADGPTGNGSTDSGSATSALSILNAQNNDSGNYTVVISNAYGSVTSTVLALTISTNPIAPSIAGLANATVVQANTATLTAVVSGKPQPALQWLFNGNPLTDGPTGNGDTISGSTSSQLSIANAQYPSSQGTYSLVASNSAGVVTNSAFLTVIVPPTITNQPVSQVVTNTQSVAFTVGATGVPAPGYQWLKNGNPISLAANSSATSATLSIASASPADTASYSCLVTNQAGSITSAAATLTVNSAALTVAALSPSNGQTGVCYDTPLYLTFSQTPTLRTAGKIQIYNVTNSTTPVDTIDMSLGTAQARVIGGNPFASYPVIITSNTAAIYPHLGVLTSNQNYYVTIDDGVFADSVGAYFAGISSSTAWSFTTKPTGAANITNLVVAADGSGDFVTVQGAVDSVPANNTTPTLINVRNGTYTEIVNINNKNNLDFRGQSTNSTLIGYANNNNLNGGAPWRASFIVNANDCAFESLCLTNMTPHGGSQAEAVDVEGTRAIFCNVWLASYQDTFLTHNAGKLLYLQDSFIQGDTDFNWGYGTVFYTNCNLHCMSTGSHVTQPRSPAGQNGLSFVNCQVTVDSSSVTSVDLGRSINTPTTPAEVIFVGCLLADAVTGYSSDAGTNFWYSSCSNLTATAERTDLQHANRLLPNDPVVLAAQDATNWLYGWVPQLPPNILAGPAGQSVAGGQPATLSVSATGVPEPAYQWLKNGTNVPGATAATLTIPSANVNDSGSYAVVVSNSAGSVTSSTVTLTVGNTAPSLAPVPDQAVNVGTIVTVTNLATDPDVPPQTLTFSLLSGPTNATLGAASGLFTWRPLVSQANSTNLITVTVADNGSPSMSATQSFNIFVNALTQPNVSSTSWLGGQLGLTVAGETGPDYAVQASTNLTDWQTVFATNSPAMPFQWADPATGAYPARFYRIVVGPPLP